LSNSFIVRKKIEEEELNNFIGNTDGMIDDDDDNDDLIGLEKIEEKLGKDHNNMFLNEMEQFKPSFEPPALFSLSPQPQIKRKKIEENINIFIPSNEESLYKQLQQQKESLQLQAQNLQQESFLPSELISHRPIRSDYIESRNPENFLWQFLMELDFRNDIKEICSSCSRKIDKREVVSVMNCGHIFDSCIEEFDVCIICFPPAHQKKSKKKKIEQYSEF